MISGILPAPESSHAIRVAIDEALKCKETGEEKTILFGLTIVAIGTSLPELVTSIVATKKGDSGLALGNAIGSNLFNILFILGFSAILSPLHVLNESIIDCGILLISSILLFIFAKTKQHMSKLEGIVCIGLYLAYMGYLLI